MNRRESLKHIALSSLGLAVMPAETSAAETFQSSEIPEFDGDKKIKIPNGRTEEEAIRDARLMKETFFTPHEMKTVTVLSDIILPADGTSGSASQAGVPAFIEFMMKDQPQHQTPIRGGLMWLDNQAMKRFSKKFVECGNSDQLKIVDDIAYPETAKKEMLQGVAFFNQMRDFVMTGFYTSEMGIKDLGYMGNRANNWEGVPDDVLKQFGLAYD
jgi:gluconate 2-dehydrogenase gamma chain